MSLLFSLVPQSQIFFSIVSVFSSVFPSVGYLLWELYFLNFAVVRLSGIRGVPSTSYSALLFIYFFWFCLSLFGLGVDFALSRSVDFVLYQCARVLQLKQAQRTVPTQQRVHFKVKWTPLSFVWICLPVDAEWTKSPCVGVCTAAVLTCHLRSFLCRRCVSCTFSVL